MTAGYAVNDGPDAGPTTPTRPGTGQEAAVGWLNRLKALAQRMCVTSTPYAQADLDALQRVGDPRLTTIAQPIQDMGCHAVDLLLRRLAEPDAAPQTMVLKTKTQTLRPKVGHRRLMT